MSELQFDEVFAKARAAIPVPVAMALPKIPSRSPASRKRVLAFSLAGAAALSLAVILPLALRGSLSPSPSTVKVGFGSGSGDQEVSLNQGVRVAYIAPRSARAGEKASLKVFAGRYDHRVADVPALVPGGDHYELRLLPYGRSRSEWPTFSEDYDLLTDLPGFGGEGYDVTITGGGCVCEGDDCSEKSSFEHAPFGCLVDTASLKIEYRFANLVDGLGTSKIYIADTTAEKYLYPACEVFFKKAGEAVTFLTFDEWYSDYSAIMRATNWRGY